jgi:LPXTG-site transpeptidase (sortase) family protein
MPKFKPKVYIKDESFDPIYSSVNFEFLFRSRVLPGIIVSLGILLLGTQVIMPLIFFKTHEKVTPEIAASVLGVATGFNEFEFTELIPKGMSAQAIPGRENLLEETNEPKYFYLSIPKLRIENAIVETNSNNLSPVDRLGHYKGSALPGQTGNALIYGHSVLPWFYNPRNYKTIFSTLDKLALGDELIITYNNVESRYKVEYEEVEKPKNIDPLEEYKPSYLNTQTVTLMTCWPPGTKSKRYMVRAIKVE